VQLLCLPDAAADPVGINDWHSNRLSANQSMAEVWLQFAAFGNKLFLLNSLYWRPA
jgi:hypothetical protein